MRFRVLCPVIWLLAALVLSVNAQLLSPAARNVVGRDSAVITGTIYGPGGLGVAGVHVELRDPASNAVLGLATTNSNGSFELYNTPLGSYEVVAELQGTQVSQLVVANGLVNQIDLHLSNAPATAQQNGDRISVARLKVPWKARDRYNKAEEAFAHGKFQDSEKAVNQSLAMYAPNPEALTLRGLLAWQNKDAEHALQDFQNAIELDPDYDVPYTAMSAVLNAQGKFDDASRETDRALAINPNAWQGYFEKAKALLGKGLYEKALEVANKAQQLGPGGFASFHLLKAYAMVPLRLYKDAGAELEAFLSHAPKGQDTSSVKSLLARVQAEAVIAPSAGPAQGLALVQH